MRIGRSMGFGGGIVFRDAARAAGVFAAALAVGCLDRAEVTPGGATGGAAGEGATSATGGGEGGASATGGGGGDGAASSGGGMPAAGGGGEGGCVPCYTGPADTEGRGTCQAGCQRGASCVGQVLPAVEDCATDADEDCNDVGCTGEHVWSTSFGGAGIASSKGIAVDASGNVIVVGDFENDLGFGESAGDTDVFVVKYSAGGSSSWRKRFGGTAADYASGVAVDPAGDIYVTGYFESTIGFGELTSSGGLDAFVLKLDGSTGSVVWAHQVGDASTQEGRAVAIDSRGNVLWLGHFAGTIRLGGTTRTSAGMRDVFLAQLDPSGAPVWLKSAGDSLEQFGVAVAVDAADNVLITGRASGTIDFGGEVLQAAGHDLYLAKLDASGSHLWSHVYGDSNAQQGSGVAFDRAGNAIVAGSAAGTVDFGGAELGGAGGDDAILAKLGPGGSHLWSHAYGDSEEQRASAVAADAAGNVALAGIFDGTIDFGGGPAVSAGGSDAFIAKLGPDGRPAWSKRVGDALFQSAVGVAMDAGGAVAVTGAFRGDISLGGQTLSGSAESNIFVAKLAP
ncbi:SBBP repeat-containing protein [Sorangium sp. So ce385]|uniref:SBBP repeat-containing protein n=1 Tax=Sorangium sp. So ce385 TaxID=3133308 RepID=UPI003F5B984D